MTLFSPVGSLNHANHTALQENGSEKRMTATSGRKCLDVFERFNRNGLWARTFSVLLIGMEGWYSTRCNLTWKVKATKYKRMYFQLAPSTPRTEETASGLLPTPTVMDTNCGDLEKIDQRREKAKQTSKNGNGFGTTIGELANRRLLPIPKTQDSRHALSDRGKSNLGEEMSQWGQDNGIGFQLNPPFVAEMMGFPPDWTELPFLSGETKASKPTETP